ncbi:hypothetical protein GQ53DRAFT_721759, partial [Thozetella sp. PMI_491]
SASQDTGQTHPPTRLRYGGKTCLSIPPFFPPLSTPACPLGSRIGFSRVILDGQALEFDVVVVARALIAGWTSRKRADQVVRLGGLCASKISRASVLAPATLPPAAAPAIDREADTPRYDQSSRTTLPPSPIVLHVVSAPRCRPRRDAFACPLLTCWCSPLPFPRICSTAPVWPFLFSILF